MAAPAPLVLPGQPLPANLLVSPRPYPGTGCYEYAGQVLASIIGRPRRDGAIINVIGRSEISSTPDIGSIVLGRVTRITSLQAHLTLLISSSQPLPESSEEFTGVVRIADVRLTERDKLKMGECFRLGDLVRAKVLSLGDARSYYLSTADNDLGVVHALSQSTGNLLVPVSWSEMEDEVTGAVERRKVAKPASASASEREYAERQRGSE